MATSVLNPTSRRGAAAAERPASPSRRRSHSVSAVSRKSNARFDDKTYIPTEFCNSRDNPLFWAPSSPHDREEIGTISENTSSRDKLSYSLNSRSPRNGSSSCNPVSEQRGRSVKRSFKEENGIGRSLSRVRNRSVSSARCKGGACENEKEHNTVTSVIAQSRSEIKKIGNGILRTNPVGNRVDLTSAEAMTNQNQDTERFEDDSVCSMYISNLEDGISVGSLSEAEEKTINVATYELNAFLRNNVDTFTATNVADTPSDEAVEVISKIRREYAIKLEESKEHTRKLRADLAVEEHRRKELDRILKEILPDPNTSDARGSRRGRRTSNERKRMSKCLTEDAMTYFDECVSLSTFDSSDFSASEEQTYSSARVILPAGASVPSTLCCYDQHSNDFHQKQLYGGYKGDYLVTGNSNTRLPHFSFADKKSGLVEPEEDIMSYIKNFKKGTKKDIDSESMPSYYDADSYNIPGRRECLLIDK